VDLPCTFRRWWCHVTHSNLALRPPAIAGC